MSFSVGQEKKFPVPKAGVEVPTGSTENKKATDDAENQAKAKKRAEDAGKLLRENMIDPRVVLRILSGSDAIVGGVDGQREVDMFVANNQGATQEQLKAIERQYEKIGKYLNRRSINIKKEMMELKNSPDPQKRALFMDIETAGLQANRNNYQRNIDEAKVTLLKGTDTYGRELTNKQKGEYKSFISGLETKLKDFDQQIDNRQTERNNIKTDDGKEVQNVVKNMAIALSGGDSEAIQIAENDPVGFIEGKLAGALTDPKAMDKLIMSMESSGFINDEADKTKFKEFLELKLTGADVADDIKKKTKSTLSILLSLSGALGYMAWKKIQEGVPNQ